MDEPERGTVNSVQVGTAEQPGKREYLKVFIGFLTSGTAVAMVSRECGGAVHWIHSPWSQLQELALSSCSVNIGE